MKCLSKKIINYRQEKAEAEWNRRYEEKLSKMTPEERKNYEENRHRKAVEALSTLSLVNSCLGDKCYK